MAKNSYDIVADKVRSFWKKTHPQTVVAFFSQKYAFETEWEFCAEIVYPKISSNNHDIYVIFKNDFCEGQTDVKDIKVVPLCDIIEFYLDNGGN